MILSSLTIFSFFSLGALETHELKFQIILHAGKDKFEKTKALEKSQTEDWLPQVDSQMEFSFSKERNVSGKKTYDASTRDRIKYVPGRDDGNRGHSWMKLVDKKGEPVLELSSALVRLKKATYPDLFPKRGQNLNKLKEGEDFDILRQTASYELEWVTGSWSDYLAGEDIELRFSKEGSLSFLTDFRNNVSREVWIALLNMKAKDAPDPEGTIWIKSLKKNKEESLDFRGRIRGNRDRFEIDWIPVQVDVTAKVEVSP